MRVFLDTNVLVSAFASRGICAEILEVVLLEHDLVTGKNVLREFDKALRQKLRLPARRCAEIIGFVSGEAVSVVENPRPIDEAVDAADARVIGEALSGQSDMFVTGDAALLKLAQVDQLPIVSPRQFWDALRSEPR